MMDVINEDTLWKFLTVMPITATVLFIFISGFALCWKTLQPYIKHLKNCRGSRHEDD